LLSFLVAKHKTDYKKKLSCLVAKHKTDYKQNFIIKADIGQTIYYEVSKEASMVFDNIMNPCDAAIVGIVDDINLEK